MQEAGRMKEYLSPMRIAYEIKIICKLVLQCDVQRRLLGIKKHPWNGCFFREAELYEKWIFIYFPYNMLYVIIYSNRRIGTACTF